MCSVEYYVVYNIIVIIDLIAKHFNDEHAQASRFHAAYRGAEGAVHNSGTS